MTKTNDKLPKFNRTNLVEAIYRVIPVEKMNLRNEVRDFIWPRLDFLHGKSNRADRYFVFEESYVETEWKDMISIHYINTSYKVQNTVMRIHVFLKPEISDDSYAGFFTLRKIDEARIMLSFIYPNWSKLYYNSQPLCVMTYKKKIHIMGKEIEFYTYPLFVQDNITVACAQVSMISMAQYLHHKFDYRKIRILELNMAFSMGKTKLFPTSGLGPTQMIEIFNFYNIPVAYQAFVAPSEYNIDEKYEKYRNYIDYTVESGMPVMLGICVEEKSGTLQRHVVQIIGHTQQDRESYIVYDDSGYFLRTFDISGFVCSVKWTTLKKYIKSEKSFIIYPIHEKIYILYDDFKAIFHHMYSRVSLLAQMEEDKQSFTSRARFLLADNRDVKHFLMTSVMENEAIADIGKDEVEKILLESMPHYVWYCEIPLDSGYFIYIANPTYWKLTTKNIFYNQTPIYSDRQFGLLNYE